MTSRAQDWTRPQMWTTVAIAAGAALATGVVVWLLTTASGETTADPGPTPTATATATPTPTPEPEPEPSPEPTPDPVDATCQNTVTAGLRAMMALQDWVVADTTGEEIGATPFITFPDGPPADQLICRWAADPGVPTDNLVDFAWAPIDVDARAGMVEALVATGFVSQETEEGIVVTANLEGDDAYLFTDTDVRWAHTIEELGYVTNPATAP